MRGHKIGLTPERRVPQLQQLEIIMRFIYSNIEPQTLLHITSEIPSSPGRKDLVESQHFLQVSSMNLVKGQSFASHRHIEKILESNVSIAQESWVILSGKVEITYFDLDDTKLESIVLGPGEISITLAGGHGYKILEDTEAFEFKSGPYFGQKLDKVFIEQSGIGK